MFQLSNPSIWRHQKNFQRAYKVHIFFQFYLYHMSIHLLFLRIYYYIIYSDHYTIIIFLIFLLHLEFFRNFASIENKKKIHFQTKEDGVKFCSNIIMIITSEMASFFVLVVVVVLFLLKNDKLFFNESVANYFYLNRLYTRKSEISL